MSTKVYSGHKGNFQRTPGGKVKLSPEQYEQLGIKIPPPPKPPPQQAPPPQPQPPVNPDPLAPTTPPKKGLMDYTEAELDAMPEEQLKRLMAEAGVDDDDDKPLPGEEGYEREYAFPTPEERGEMIVSLSAAYPWHEHPGYDQIRGMCNAIVGTISNGVCMDVVYEKGRNKGQVQEQNAIVTAFTNSACGMMWNMSRSSGQMKPSMGQDLIAAGCAMFLAHRMGRPPEPEEENHRLTEEEIAQAQAAGVDPGGMDV